MSWLDDIGNGISGLFGGSSGSSGGGSSVPNVGSSYNFNQSGSAAPASSALILSQGQLSGDPMLTGQGSQPIQQSTMGSIADTISGLYGDLKGATGLTGKEILGDVAGAGVMGAKMLMPSPTTKQEKALTSQASAMGAQGAQLASYLQSGTLPPGAQAWVDQQTAAQSAQIRAKYAAMGLPGSTMENEELNNVKTQATGQMFQIANQLLQTGIQETGASGQLYNYLMQNANTQDASNQQAIMNFVSELGGGTQGGGKGTTITIGGKQ